MNETKTNETSHEPSFMTMFWAYLDYILNKFMPTLLVSFICFYSFGFYSWESYFVIGLMLFSNSFNFKCGYANCCLDNGIDEKIEEL
jgi:hypothetical protein